MKPPRRRRHATSGLPGASLGFTLVELLVTITIMLLITMATIALYTVNSSSYRTVDSSQDMDTTARFIFSIMGTAIENAGYAPAVPLEMTTAQNVANLFNNGAGNCTATGSLKSAAVQPCPVFGRDAAYVTETATATDFGTSSHSSAVNSSDLLALRFYGSGAGTSASSGDGAIISCSGRGVPTREGISNVSDIGMSMFWVSTPKTLDNASKDTEPSLYCTDLAWDQTDAAMKRDTNAIARGVEVMQIMYGEDVSSPADETPDRWVSAADVSNWQRVKAIRVGLVLRGQPGSSQAGATVDYYPLGKDFVASDSAQKFTAPNDGRMRKTFVATFGLRNKVTS